jgi:hypothetical protein
VQNGAHLQRIAEEVQAYVESFGFSMLRVASGTGHSIGQVHADGWLIPYYHDPRNEGHVLEKNMVFSVEPFICAGSGEGTRLTNNTRSAVTADDSLAVYWEHIVAVTVGLCHRRLGAQLAPQGQRSVNQPRKAAYSDFFVAIGSGGSSIVAIDINSNGTVRA